MNYQFIRDIQGKPIAQFDMGSEAFSLWFSEELSDDVSTITAILEAIEKLQNKEIKEYALEGNDVTLLLTSDEAEVRSKMLDIDAPDELPEGTELYDQESISGCGLEDFIRVIDSWRDFISDK